MEVFRSQIRSGILILVSTVVLAVGVFLVSDIRTLWEEKKQVMLLFRYADGISKGSPVWFAGLEVGEVSQVRIAPGKDDRIALTLLIDPKARVRKDSKAYIRNLGMMGSKYVEISPGSPGSPEIAPGDTLEGETPSSLAEVIEIGQQMAQTLQGTIVEIHGLVQEIRQNAPIQQLFQNANGFMEDMRQRSKDLEGIFRKVDTLLSSSQESLDGLAGSLKETARNVNRTAVAGGGELVALLKELRDTNRGLQTTMSRIEGQITPILGQARQGVTEAGGLMRDARSVLDANDQNLYLLLLQLEETSRHLQGLSEDLRAHPWKVVWKGDGQVDEKPRSGPEEWRAKGRIGRHGKE
jgi:phospholipid/cholesterol/gamma-HCH transport system substrate-binding protein